MNRKATLAAILDFNLVNIKNPLGGVMLRKLLKTGAILFLGILFLYSCQQSPVENNQAQVQSNQILNKDKISKGELTQETPLLGEFIHGPIVMIDGEEYYLAPGAPDGPNGATDIPGHYWRQISANRLQGKHYNTGPFGKPSWWSSDAPNGALLYLVQGIIDTWSKEKAKRYAKKGIVHYHEFVRVSDGKKHPTKILWFRHIAVRSFTLDGGPHPEFGHEVEPGVDFEFIPNGMMPYDPES